MTCWNGFIRRARGLKSCIATVQSSRFWGDFHTYSCYKCRLSVALWMHQTYCTYGDQTETIRYPLDLVDHSGHLYNTCSCTIESAQSLVHKAHCLDTTQWRPSFFPQYFPDEIWKSLISCVVMHCDAHPFLYPLHYTPLVKITVEQFRCYLLRLALSADFCFGPHCHYTGVKWYLKARQLGVLSSLISLSVNTVHSVHSGRFRWAVALITTLQSGYIQTILSLEAEQAH